MNILYKKVPASRSVPSYLTNTDNLAPDLEPTGNGVIDIINDFPWTFTPGNPANQSTKAREETPVIQLQEFYIKQSAIQQQLKPYDFSVGFEATDTITTLGQLIRVVGRDFLTSTEKLYEGIFDGNDDNFSGFLYMLPYFSQVNFTTNNSWEKKDLLNTIVEYQQKFSGPIGRGANAAIPAIITKIFKNKGFKMGLGNIVSDLPSTVRDVNLLALQGSNPAVGLLDPPHLFQSSSPRQIQISFYLYNTHSTSSNKKEVEQTIVKNWELCYMLSYQNSVNKKNFFTGLCPVFYRVTIPGVHYSKASIITNLSISNIGNVRKLILPIDGGSDTDVNVPDAYKIDINLQDVFMPSKNLYAAVNDVWAERVVAREEPPPGGP